MKRIILIIILVLCIIFLQACSSIDQGYAEFFAKKFVRENVKFFSKDERQSVDLPTYNITSISSYKEGRLWVVNMHVEAQLGNETKKNDITVKINGKGDVVEFDGKKVKY